MFEAEAAIRVYSASELRRRLDLDKLINFLDACHRHQKGETADSLIGDDSARYLVRSATSDRVYGTKLVTIVPSNVARGRASVQSIFALFDRQTGVCRAILDATEMTYWKTAADSALGSRYLSRLDATTLLICGAGGLAPWLIRGHIVARPSINRVLIWNRTLEKAIALAARLVSEGCEAEAIGDLEGGFARADIVSTATMAKAPFVLGRWLRPGQHLDLVGSFSTDTREADDDCARRARVFVDSRETALHGVGDILGPIASGALIDVRGDLYDLANGAEGRTSPDDITLFKNAGGAHLDLMTAEFLIQPDVAFEIASSCSQILE